MNSSLASLITYILSLFLSLVAIVNISSTDILSGSTILRPFHDSTEIVNVSINTDSSLIYWKGTEMWETGKHEGTVTLKEGYLSYNNGQIIGGKFIADMNSIAITDIPEHESVPRRRLRNHLKSEDFFYVEKYPVAEFEITKTEALKADSLRVRGNLSIRDVTKTASFMASQKSGHKNKTEFYATFKIDRFEWNISYQGSYWDRITSILDNTFVDADIRISVKLVTLPAE